MIDALVENGLLQFGRFEDGDDFKPYSLNLHLLPAYPDVLRHSAAEIAGRIQDIDRIVCEADSVPLGVAVSLQSGIPLIYSNGRNESGVYDLVGAYDVGHPAVLVVNILDDTEHLRRLIKKARGVGLEIKMVVAIIGIRIFDDVPTQSLLNLATVIRLLVDSGDLAAAQGNSVLEHLNAEGSNLRQDKPC
jgi:hypothetical protein